MKKSFKMCGQKKITSIKNYQLKIRMTNISHREADLTFMKDYIEN